MVWPVLARLDHLLDRTYINLLSLFHFSSSLKWCLYTSNIKLGECIALWGERKQVLLCGRCWCTFVCKWHNSKRAVLHRLHSNLQTLADPESSQSAPAVHSKFRSSPSSLTQPKSSQPASALGLCRRRVADFDTLAVALICYAAWGRLPSYPHTLLLSPAFPPIGHCVTCNRLGRTGIRKPTKVCGCVNLVCGGFKHIYINICMTTYIYIR